MWGLLREGILGIVLDIKTLSTAQGTSQSSEERTKEDSEHFMQPYTGQPKSLLGLKVAAPATLFVLLQGHVILPMLFWSPILRSLHNQNSHSNSRMFPLCKECGSELLVGYFLCLKACPESTYKKYMLWSHVLPLSWYHLCLHSGLYCALVPYYICLYPSIPTTKGCNTEKCQVPCACIDSQDMKAGCSVCWSLIPIIILKPKPLPI